MLDLLIYFGIYLAVISAVVSSGVFMYSALDGTRDMKIEGINPAIATSMAGFFGGVSLILMNAFSGPTHLSIKTDFLEITGYAFLGLFVLMASKALLDKVVFADINFKEALVNDNRLVAIREAAGSIATGVAVFSSLYWVDFSQEGGMVTGAFVLILIALSMLIHGYVFRKRGDINYAAEKDSEEYKAQLAPLAMRCAEVISWAFSLGAGFALSNAMGLSPFVSVASAPVLGVAFMFIVSLVSGLFENRLFGGETTGDGVSRAIVRLVFFTPSLMFFM